MRKEALGDALTESAHRSREGDQCRIPAVDDANPCVEAAAGKKLQHVVTWWTMWHSLTSGRNEIYVRPFPNVNDGGRQQVSTNGGRQPRWARNGEELFYESMGTLMRVPVKTGSTFERGPPEKVVDASPYLVRPRWGSGRMYEVSADGRRFLITEMADERPPSARIILVQNWFEELKRRVPTK